MKEKLYMCPNCGMESDKKDHCYSKDTPPNELTGGWEERWDKLVSSIDGIYSGTDPYFARTLILAHREKMKYFIASELKKQREEIKKDMKRKMKNWHGTGSAMVEDYFTNLDTK